MSLGPVGPHGQDQSGVMAAMDEWGIDLSQEFPKPLTDEFVKAADAVITMGCGEACPIYPGKRYEDWELDDPAGQPVEVVRRIRDDIDARVQLLLAGAYPNFSICGLPYYLSATSATGGRWRIAPAPTWRRPGWSCCSSRPPERSTRRPSRSPSPASAAASGSCAMTGS
jgi:Low molecular weight phosphotyrosine protein phosphatase